MMEFNSNKPQTVFHGGFQYLQRIDTALNHLNDITRMRETAQGHNLYIVWQQNITELKVLYKELYVKMDDEEKDEHEENYDCILAISVFVRNYYKKYRTLPTSLLEFFDLWEMDLRNIIEDKGLLMPNKASMSDAIGGD